MGQRAFAARLLSRTAAFMSSGVTDPGNPVRMRRVRQGPLFWRRSPLRRWAQGPRSAPAGSCAAATTTPVPKLPLTVFGVILADAGLVVRIVIVGVVVIIVVVTAIVVTFNVWQAVRRCSNP